MWSNQQTATTKITMVEFFVFFYSTRFNPGMYLAVIFYQPGKKTAQLFFTRLVKKNG